MEETAIKASWNNQPIDHPKRIPIVLRFTVEEFNMLKKGLVPVEMEDKWFIYYEKDWLYMHRSWTGFGIYKAKINQETHGYSIQEFWVERNPKKYGNEDDSRDIENFIFLISEGLLRKNVRSNHAATIHSESDALRSWQLFGKLLFADNKLDRSYAIKSALLGIAVGDAMGVPVEFKTREEIARDPIVDMTGYGTYNLPPGTWSDDSSLAFCLAEALTDDFNLADIGRNFVKWYYENFWTPSGNVFDIGITTKQAIQQLAKGIPPELAGSCDVSSNGNGSLMRILPLVFHIHDKPIHERYDLTKQVSSITHGHVRSVIACFYLLEFARQVIHGKEKFEIYGNLKKDFSSFLTSITVDQSEIALFERVLKGNIHEQDESSISSTGYVLHTLESAIWCIMTTENYKDTILKAVNLGDDTDSTAAVAGGIAGLLYGYDGIPENWLNLLARKQDIEHLASRLSDRVMGR